MARSGDDDNDYDDDDEEEDDSIPLAKVTPIWIALTVEISAEPTYQTKLCRKDKNDTHPKVAFEVWHENPETVNNDDHHKMMRKDVTIVSVRGRVSTEPE